MEMDFWSRGGTRLHRAALVLGSGWLVTAQLPGSPDKAQILQLMM